MPVLYNISICKEAHTGNSNASPFCMKEMQMSCCLFNENEIKWVPHRKAFSVSCADDTQPYSALTDQPHYKFMCYSVGVVIHFFFFLYCFAQLRKREISTEIYVLCGMLCFKSLSRDIRIPPEHSQHSHFHSFIRSRLLAVYGSAAIGLMPSSCYATHTILCTSTVTTLHHIFFFFFSIIHSANAHTLTHSMIQLQS